MYAKVFTSIFDSTINEQPLHVFKVWIALLTFAQDGDGIVDMTTRAIANRTELAIEQVEDAIRVLSDPDPMSRCQEQEGRRIVPIPGRPYGWQIVTFAHYRDLKRGSDRREYMREYMRDRRSGNSGKQPVSRRKQTLALSTDTASASASKELSSALRAIGDEYRRLADEWGKRKIQDATLVKLEPKIEECTREMLRDDASFSFVELLQRVRQQSNFFRDEWQAWDLTWFVDRKKGVRNAAKVWALEYAGGDEAARASSAPPHPLAPGQPGFTV